MELNIKEINNKEIWEEFLAGCEEKTFLQSWNWGEFQLLEGNKIWRLGIYNSEQRTVNNEQLIAVALVVKITARRGTFLFVPHLPSVALAKEDGPKIKHQILKILLEKLKELAVQEKASFIRISPFWQRNEENNQIFKELGFREAPIHMHAEVTWELDIKPTEEEILAGMRKTTRYLIRQAQKNPDIEIIKSQNISGLEEFNKIYLETAKRHKFVVFPERYLKNQFSTFFKDNEIMFFFGKYKNHASLRSAEPCNASHYKNEIISVAIFVFWQNMAFYHHSGSLTKYSKIPVNYLLHWEAIKEAKKRGCEIYNFWGISPDIKTEEDAKKSKHPWAGLSLFKMGFGGYRRELIKTQDFVISKKYWLTYFFEKLRKAKRGL